MWNTCAAAIPHLPEQGAGGLVNISTACALKGFPFLIWVIGNPTREPRRHTADRGDDAAQVTRGWAGLNPAGADGVRPAGVKPCKCLSQKSFP
jgi:hypothetical protein